MADDLVFIQRSRFGRTIFLLRGETLEISAHLFGQKSCRDVLVRSISPDYTLEAVNFNRVVVVTGTGAALCFALFFTILFRWKLPPLVAQLPAYGGVLCLVVALTYLRRMEFFTFHDQWGRPLFSILREKEQSDECDAFVRELLDRIEHAADSSHGAPSDLRQLTRPVNSAVRLEASDPFSIVRVESSEVVR